MLKSVSGKNMVEKVSGIAPRIYKSIILNGARLNKRVPKNAYRGEKYKRKKKK
jgi:hypothetical protein